VTEETTTTKTAEEIWLDELNSEVTIQAEELGKVLQCEVDAFVFVIEPLKDAAVGFFRKPDAKQALKFLRLIGENYENGVEMIARAQLIRQTDLQLKGVEGSASDMRFMDANGNYDPKYSSLNFNMVMRSKNLIELFTDQFKKK
jgi:hypothetical protein